jgi:decaprenylphosphoryl-5-phosphoribose phosphatase
VSASLDHRLLLLARTRGHTPARDRAVAAFSKTGEHAACWLALGSAGAIADADRRSQWLRATITVAVSYALNTAIKFAVRRRRPQLPGLPPLTSTVTALSFPSAHATTSFTAAGVYRAMIPATPLYAVASLFAVSRPYLGVHYPSDVVAGALLGSVLAAGTERAGVTGCR